MIPTVLIFLKTPVMGQVKTRLAADVGEAEALRIYRWLVERQLAAIPAGWPVEVHYSPGMPADEAVMRAWLGEAPGRSFWPQPEAGLGERLRVATVAAFRRGARGVFLIGGDCPDLDTAALAQAAGALSAADVVMSPAVDGGYVLLGMREARTGLLTEIAWSTDRVADQTRTRAAAEGLRLVELPVRADVDTAADWHSFETRLP